MNVLSLFDGISCGRIALDRAGIPVKRYYASEIDKKCVELVRMRYPDTVMLGDVTGVSKSSILDERGIDLLIGGSPCTNFSASGKRNGMVTEENVDVTSLEQYLSLKEEGFRFAGQSYLFWEYMRLMKETKPKHFLLENVNMADKWKDIITENLGVEPIMINSRLVSAQNRVRLYWTNIPGVSMPEDKEVRLVDILEDKSYTNPGAIRGRHKPTIQCLEVRDSYRDKSNCLTTVEKDNVLTPLSPGRYEDAYGKFSGNKLPFRYYTRLEYERLQTLPDHYTEPMGDSAAKKAVGNGWTVDVIAHIFRGISEQTKL